MHKTHKSNDINEANLPLGFRPFALKRFHLNLRSMANYANVRILQHLTWVWLGINTSIHRNGSTKASPVIPSDRASAFYVL